MKIKIAENIRKFRKENSLTQEQLAEALGVTVGAVYKWESGLSMPEIKLMMEMADLFEISVDVLLGYEQQNGNVENRITRIKQCILEKNLEEAVTEAQKALKKYPNNFDVVYLSGIMYQVKFTEDNDVTSLQKSNELFKRAIPLLYQNSDNRINQATISNHIAENYLRIEQIEQALEIFKQNNIRGINNSLIGHTYARKLKQPAEAKPYLIASFANTFNDIIRTVSGLAYMYAETNVEMSIEAIKWLNDFLDSLKSDRDNITFIDKLKAAAMAQSAVFAAASGDYIASEEYIQSAYSLAKSFDDAPVYNMQRVRFFQGEDSKLVAYDDIGKTAFEAVENIIFDDKQSKANKFVCDIWEEMKSGKIN